MNDIQNMHVVRAYENQKFYTSTCCWCTPVACVFQVEKVFGHIFLPPLQINQKNTFLQWSRIIIE